MQLTDRFCATVKPEAAQKDYFDETVSGLALRVSKTGARTWSFVWNSGKARRITLGRYPEISLAAARGKAMEARSDISEGRDPLASKAQTLRAVWEKYLVREGGKLRSIHARTKAMEVVDDVMRGRMPGMVWWDKASPKTVAWLAKHYPATLVSGFAIPLQRRRVSGSGMAPNLLGVEPSRCWKRQTTQTI